MPVNNVDNSNLLDKIPYAEIVEYLNSKAKTNYRSTTKSTRLRIKIIWNDGFRLNDFKKVIDNKVLDWKGKFTKQGVLLSNFLRPDTLFRSKFESYLNQKSTGNSKGNSGTFNNFEQRNYDCKELERKLLGYE